jgi:hypothetical protein
MGELKLSQFHFSSDLALLLSLRFLDGPTASLCEVAVLC